MRVLREVVATIVCGVTSISWAVFPIIVLLVGSAPDISWRVWWAMTPFAAVSFGYLSIANSRSLRQKVLTTLGKFGEGVAIMIEIYVYTDHMSRLDCIYHHLEWHDIQDALNKLHTAGFRDAAEAAEPPEVTVAIQISFGGFVPEGGGTSSPKRHPVRLCLPGADLERTKAALIGLGARQAG